jgi:peptidoglycan hydrolase-like protein with peptidoglycan-binding domain
MPTTISLGSTGDDVKRLQRALARIQAWNPFGPISGVFDASLRTSVENYQREHGLTRMGLLGPRPGRNYPAIAKLLLPCKTDRQARLLPGSNKSWPQA